VNKAQRTIRTGAIGLLVGSSVVLAACSSSGSSATQETSTRTSVAAPGASIPFNEADNARADVKVGTCTQVSGAWVFTGSVVNTATKARTFQIVVDFVSKPGSTVLGTTVVTVPDVGAGATGHWSTTGAQGKPNVACVVRLAQVT
jgi:hypothetical protein